jgi:hypothetical protein
MSMQTVAASVPNISFPLPPEFSRAFWQWYDVHKDDVVVEKGFLFFHLQVHVRDLKPLFVKLFGPH